MARRRSNGKDLGLRTTGISGEDQEIWKEEV